MGDPIVTTTTVEAMGGGVFLLPPNTEGNVDEFLKDGIIVTLNDNGEGLDRNFYWAIVNRNQIKKVE